MKAIILFFLLYLSLSPLVQAQSLYDQFMSEGKSSYEQFDFDKAISKFKAAKISPGITELQIQEADRQIERARDGFIAAIQKANEETKLALEQSKLEARISEANRLAFMANQYVEKENYQEAFQLASIAMTMVKDDPPNLVERAFGDAGYRYFSDSLEYINSVVLDIQNQLNGNIVVRLRNQPPLVFDQSGKLINRLTGHVSRIIDLTLSPVDGSIATCAEDGSIHFWDSNGQIQQIYQTNKPGIYASQLISIAASRVLAVFNDHSLSVFTTEGVEMQHIQEANKISSLTASPDGKLLLTCTANGLVKLWDATTMTLIKELTNTGNYIHQAVFTKDGSKIIVAPEGQPALIFDSSGRQLSVLVATSNPTGFYEIICAPDEATIALAAKNGAVEIWNIDGQFLSSYQRGTDQRQLLKFSPDSKKLLSIDKDNNFVLWGLAKGDAVYFDQHRDALSVLCFSPDGQYILSASKDHTAKLWKPDGSLIMNLDRHKDAIRVALFSKDGKHIITGGTDHQIFYTPTFDLIVKKKNDREITELTSAQKQKWGLD